MGALKKRRNTEILIEAGPLSREQRGPVVLLLTAHAYYLERDTRNFERIRPFVEREFEDPESVFLLLRAVFDGLRFRSLRDPQRIDLRAEWHAVQDIVLSTLKRRNST